MLSPVVKLPILLSNAIETLPILTGCAFTAVTCAVFLTSGLLILASVIGAIVGETTFTPFDVSKLSKTLERDWANAEAVKSAKTKIYCKVFSIINIKIAQINEADL